MSQQLSEARREMQGCLQSTLIPAAYLAGADTLGACMGDPDLRAFLGHALLDEIMPAMSLPRGEAEQLAMALCREMEGPLARQPLLPLTQNGARAWACQALPVLEEYRRQKGAVPPCLCLGLSALIMFYAGARRDGQGRYTGLREGQSYPLSESEEALAAFSRLSCDMPPEMLAYAVLSDQELWEKDLRQIPGLEDTVAAQLRDLQLIGLRAALQRAWEEKGG